MASSDRVSLLALAALHHRVYGRHVRCLVRASPRRSLVLDRFWMTAERPGMHRKIGLFTVEYSHFTPQVVACRDR